MMYIPLEALPVALLAIWAIYRGLQWCGALIAGIMMDMGGNNNDNR